MLTSKSRRRIVVRGGRRYALCAKRATFASAAAAAPATRYFLWPGLTLLAVVLFSAYVIGRPPDVSVPGERGPVASVQRFSFDDLANGLR